MGFKFREGTDLLVGMHHVWVGFVSRPRRCFVAHRSEGVSFVPLCADRDLVVYRINGIYECNTNMGLFDSRMFQFPDSCTQQGFKLQSVYICR